MFIYETLKEILCVEYLGQLWIDVGFPSVCYEYVLLVNKDAALAYHRAGYR